MWQQKSIIKYLNLSYNVSYKKNENSRIDSTPKIQVLVDSS